MEKIISEIKSDFHAELSNEHPHRKKLNQLIGELRDEAQQLVLLPRDPKAQADYDKKLKEVEVAKQKQEILVEEFENGKIYQRAFEWRFEFPEVLDDKGNYTGFDAIIGNPPYIRPHKISSADKEYFWEHYRTFTHKADIYCCFIEKASSLLKLAGLFSYIVSRSWLQLNSFQVLRRHLLDNYTINTLIDFPYNIFDSASVFTSIFVAKKTPVTIGHEIQIVKHHDEKGKALFESLRKIPQIAFEHTFQNVFDLSISPETESIKIKMRQGLKIGDKFQICFGLKTADDKKFLHKRQLNPEDRRLLRGDDIKRYAIQYKDEYVWYVPEKMRKNKATARPGEAARFEQPKILVKDTSADFGCTFDAENYYVKDVLIIILKTHIPIMSRHP